MHPIILKTFGGLSLQYYFRQFIFGLIFPLIIVFIFLHDPHGMGLNISALLLSILNTFLYPYSRFTYEGAIGFIMGDNTIFANVFSALLIKCISMTMCWSLAIFIAPAGLLYLYYHHSKAIR